MSTAVTEHGHASYEALREAVGQAKRDDPLRPVTLVVPSELVGVTARRFLTAGVTDGRPGIAALSIVTLRRMAEQLAGVPLARAGRVPLTSSMLATAIRDVLAATPGAFAPVAEHPGTVEALARAHRELRTLPAEMVDTLAQHSPLTSDVVRIHREVTRTTRDGFFDEVDLLTEAMARIDDSDPRPVIVSFLLHDLDPVESRFLDAVLRQATDHTTIAAETTTSPTGHRVLAATDPDDEVRTVLREVTAALQTHPGHCIAVLYSSPSPYARLLSEHLAAAGITHFGRGVRPASERILGRAVLRLLQLPDHDYRRSDVLGFISDARPRDNGQRAAASQWERLSRDAGVVRGRDWDRLEALADTLTAANEREAATEEPRQWLIDRNARQIEAARAFHGFVDRLRADLTALDTASTWGVATGILRRLWTDVLGGDDVDHLPDEERTAAHHITAAIDSMAGLGAFSHRPGVAAAREVLEMVLADDLGRTGRAGIGVHVGPLSDAYGLDVDQLFVVGLAEGLAPRRYTEDPLLPEEVRRLTDGLLPTRRDLIRRQHEAFSAALSGAQHRVLSFPRGDLRRGGDRVPSRWLVPTLRTLSGDAQLQATNWDKGSGVELTPSHAYGVENAPLPATLQEWQQQQALTGSLDDDNTLAAVTLRRARRSAEFTRFDGNLTSVGDLPDPTGGRSVSPTAIEAWVACPHGYFMRHVLGLSELETPEDIVEMAATDRGTLMHAIYERFIDEHLANPPSPDTPWTEADVDRIHAIAEEEFDHAEQRGITGAPLLSEQTREVILADLAAFLERDSERRRVNRLTPVATELPFGFLGHDPVQLTLPDGRTFALRGKADRLDRAADGTLWVVDYKTGKSDFYKDIGPANPLENGHRLQLPVYALAALATVDGATAVRSEYWFTSRKGNYVAIGYDVDEAVLDATRAALTVAADGISRGLFPPRPTAESHAYGCEYCDLDGLGEVDIARGWHAKQNDPALADYLALIQPDGGPA